MCVNVYTNNESCSSGEAYMSSTNISDQQSLKKEAIVLPVVIIGSLKNKYNLMFL